MKNMRKMLATAMVLVMALSAVVIVSGDSSEAATDITYISGKIMDNQEYKAGAIVVQNGDLSIEAGKTLTIAQGASFTVASGYTLTVNDGATFQVNNGALVVVDGKLDVKSGGKVVNGSIFDNTSKVDGKLAGFFVNGEMNVAKKAVVSGSVQSEESDETDEQSSNSTVSVADSVDKSGMSEITDPTVRMDGDRIIFSGQIPVHMNGAGNWGAWVGIKVTGLETDSITTVIDGRSQTYNISGNEDYFYTTAGKAVKVSISYTASTTTVTKTFILDATKVNVLGPSGQIIVNGALTTTSSGLTHSSVKDQIVSVSESGKVSLKGDVSGTVVSAFTDSKNPYTYGAVFVDAVDSDENRTNNVVDLDFTTKSEKISLAFLGENGDDDSTKKAQNIILDVSGSIQGSYVTGTPGVDYSVEMTVLKTIPSAGMKDGQPKVLYYSNGMTDNPKSSGVSMAGKVSVNGSLSVEENATFKVEEGAILDVSGKVTVDGNKGASDERDKAKLTLNGFTNVTGTMKVGGVVGSDGKGAVVLTLGGYITVEGAGVVSMQDAEVETITKAFGAAFVDENDVLWMMSLPAAIAAAEAGDVSDINLWSIYGSDVSAKKVQKKDYKVSADIVIPNGINLVVDGTIVISSGSTMTIKDGADVSGSCLFNIKGTFIDETLMTGEDLYGNAVQTNEIHIKADVRSIDGDETAYTYTTLKSALQGADSMIELFGKVSVSGALTIPAGKTVILGDKDLEVGKNSELIVDGILVANGTGKVVLVSDVGQGETAAILTINNIVVASEVYKSETASVNVSGIYAEGTIGDYKESEFILAPSVAADSSKTLENLVIKAKTSVSGELTFTASKDAGNATITIDGEAVFGKITLAGFGLSIGTGVLTATLDAEVAEGVSSVELNKVKNLTFVVEENDSGDEVVKQFVIESKETTLSGNLTVTQGVVYVHGNLIVGNYGDTEKAGNVLTVASGAELIIPEDSKVTSKADDDIPPTYIGFIIDGKVSVINGVIEADAASSADRTNSDGTILVNGELFITETRTNEINGILIIKGTLNVDTSDKTAGKLIIKGELIVGEEPDALGASAAVVGAIDVDDPAIIVVYPGSDMSKALINYDPSTGGSDIKKVDYIIDGKIYRTVYGDGETVIPVPGKVVISGFDPILYSTASSVNDWYMDPEFEMPYDESYKMKDYAAVYAMADPSTAKIKVSVGTGMSLWVDGVKYDTGAELVLKVGTYNVEATIDPGYKGTVRISFDGSQVTDGKMVVTPEMSSRTAVDSENFIILSATGDISVDSGSVPAPTPVTPAQNDGSMGITEYLLIVLVILAAILVVVVAIRMMRS